MHRFFVAVALSMLAPVAVAAAQPADFNAVVQPTVAVNQSLVQQLGMAVTGSDLATLEADAAAARTTGEQLAQDLTQALSVAPDDPSRSRVEGVLTHTQAVLVSLRQAANDSTVDTLRGRLEQARAEAQEGLDELEPFVAQLPAPVAQPAVLPTAGSLNGPELALLPSVGLWLILIGVSLHRPAVRRAGRLEEIA